MRPENYLKFDKEKNTQIQNCSVALEVNKSSDVWRISSAFFKSYLIIFDLEKNQTGLVGGCPHEILKPTTTKPITSVSQSKAYPLLVTILLIICGIGIVGFAIVGLCMICRRK